MRTTTRTSKTTTGLTKTQSGTEILITGRRRRRRPKKKEIRDRNSGNFHDQKAVQRSGCPAKRPSSEAAVQRSRPSSEVGRPAKRVRPAKRGPLVEENEDILVGNKDMLVKHKDILVEIKTY